MLLAFACTAAVHADISVTYDGPPSDTTCTLAQAINAANAANGVAPASYGSATPAGNCVGAVGSNNILLLVPTVTLTTIDNYWYGPNALPPIASTIFIAAFFKITTIRAVHTGDPTPATANAFRLFYVSGGMELPAGSLTILNAVLQGGYAKGGNSNFSGGGAGIGGAIFNQGNLSLRNVSLIGNTAQGGTAINDDFSPNLGGGGMGQDGQAAGGGFGGALGAAYGGHFLGGGGGSGGGGGGGFVSGSDASGSDNGNGEAGGGKGGLGGTGGAGINSGGAGGDGGGGGGGSSFTGGGGGGFGNGGGNGNSGASGGGGGGVGGGGGRGGGGGGGGFGGGGGAAGSGLNGGNGGFGGGGGRGGSGGSGGGGGFGGGNGQEIFAGSGAGMGGAIFNHTGTVYLLNVTATGNAANGGGNGSGLGAVLFNLNGSVTIDFSTLAGNFLSGNNSLADNAGPEDGTVYSLAYGNKIQDGTASSATLTIHNSIVHGTQANSGLRSDVSVNVVNGANTNASSLVYAGKNFIGQSYTVTGVTQTGTSPSTSDPLLGSLSLYLASPAVNSNPTPVLPIGSNSPAYDAAPSCLEADGATPLPSDERFTVRPQFSQCDVGAYEFDGDYIFADGVDVKL